MDPKNRNVGEAMDEAAETAASHVEGALARDLRTPMASDGGIRVSHASDSSMSSLSGQESLDEKGVTREQKRSRRKRDVRARTISVKRMTKRELEMGRALYPDVEDVHKPVIREHCAQAERPCPFVSCKHHLYLDVSARTGAIKLNFPDLEVWEMTESCALDVSDRGGTTLEEVGAIMNLTRERIRQVEVKGLAKLEALKDMSALRDYIDEGPVGKRRLPILAKPAVVEEEEDIENEFDSPTVVREISDSMDAE